LAQLVFRPENHHPYRWKPPIQRARNLGVAHSLVVTQKECNLIFFWQANQLFSHLAMFFPTQNLGEWRRSRIVADLAKVGSRNARILLPLSLPQLINAMPACHLREPRREGRSLVFSLQNPV
jgi:hypothetical protein